MKEQKESISWVCKHKKQIIIAGISIGTIIVFVLAIKNRHIIKSCITLEKAIEKPTVEAVKIKTVKTICPVIKNVISVPVQHHETIPFDVRKHIRNLPKGWHASLDKISTALENGFELADGQTWVIDYAKGMVA